MVMSSIAIFLINLVNIQKPGGVILLYSRRNKDVDLTHLDGMLNNEVHVLYNKV